jgi:hypothetical protein
MHMPFMPRTVRQLADTFLLRGFNGCTDALSIHRCFRFMLNSDIAWKTLYCTFLNGVLFIGSIKKLSSLTG